MIKTLRATVLFLAVCLLVAGCVSTGGGRGHPGEHGRLGMDRVSPVRSADLNTRLGVGYFERGDLKIAIEKLERAKIGRASCRERVEMSDEAGALTKKAKSAGREAHTQNSGT